MPECFAARRARFADLDALQPGWRVELRGRGGGDDAVDALFFSPAGAPAAAALVSRALGACERALVAHASSGCERAGMSQQPGAGAGSARRPAVQARLPCTCRADSLGASGPGLLKKLADVHRVPSSPSRLHRRVAGPLLTCLGRRTWSGVLRALLSHRSHAQVTLLAPLPTRGGRRWLLTSKAGPRPQSRVCLCKITALGFYTQAAPQEEALTGACTPRPLSKTAACFTLEPLSHAPHRLEAIASAQCHTGFCHKLAQTASP